MAHQYPIGSRQYQAQRDFSNNNANSFTFSVAAERQVYFNPAQSRLPPRAVQRRQTHYQSASPAQHLQQQNPVAYPARRAQPLHSSPTSVISSHPYGDLYEQLSAESYEHQEFIPTTSYPSATEQGFQQSVDLPNGYAYDFGEQIYLQDAEPTDGHLSEAYQHQQCFVGQQEESISDFVADETYAPIKSYYEIPVSSPTNRQFIVSQEQHPQVVSQAQFEGESSPVARSRLSGPLQHSHHQMENIHQLSQEQQNYHHQPQHIQRQTQQHNSMLANGGYFDPRRVRANLSDEQAHQPHHNLRLLEAPVQGVMVQNPSRLMSQTYYSQTNDESYDAAPATTAAVSAPPLDFIPQQNLPLRNRQDMSIDNGSSVAGVTTASSIYVPADESLNQVSSPVEVPAGINIPFESPIYESQLTTPSSSVLSKPNNMITSSTLSAVTAILARDQPETNEKPLTSMLPGDALALARRHLDSRDMTVLPDGRLDIASFSAVYDCNRVSRALAPQTTTLQHQQLQLQQQQHSPQRSQAAKSQELPFTNAHGSTSNNQEHVTGILIKNESLAPSPISDQRLLSSPKSDPREYLDMGTSGIVRQDWLDSICGHLIEHMNNFGICVIDDFLGSIKGELILQEVHRLYSNRRYSKGRLVSDKLREGLNQLDPPDGGETPSSTGENNNSSMGPPQKSERGLQGMAADATGTIRSDRVIWVDGCEDGCEEINNLIQTLCSVITNSSRLSLYTDNGLDKANINKRTKAHVACYPGSGTRYIKHVDNPNGDGRVITAIYYLNKNWNTKRDGGLLRMFPAGMDEVANIEPLFDRALFFWSDRRNPHEVLPSFRDRYAITVWYIGETRL